MTIKERVGLALVALVTTPTSAQPSPEMKMLSVTIVAVNADPSGIPVGGVSGIDFDPHSENWVLISDDKSEYAPARFWHARIEVVASAIPSN